jgi:hypothetical protein
MTRHPLITQPGAGSMVGGSGLSKKRRRRGALRGCCDVWRWLGPPLHDPAGASNRKPLYLMVNLQMESPYIQWKFRDGTIYGTLQKYYHRIGWWDNLNRNPLYLMVKTMVSGVDFPVNTNPLLQRTTRLTMVQNAPWFNNVSTILWLKMKITGDKMILKNHTMVSTML